MKNLNLCEPYSPQLEPVAEALFQYAKKFELCLHEDDVSLYSGIIQNGGIYDWDMAVQFMTQQLTMAVECDEAKISVTERHDILLHICTLMLLELKRRENGQPSRFS